MTQFTKILDVPVIPQIGDYTCWAACQEMITTYFGSEYAQSQCSILNERCVNFSCCDSQGNILFKKGSAPCDSTSVAVFDSSLWHIQSINDLPPATDIINALVTQIDTGTPSYISIEYTDSQGGGHALVLIGYSKSMKDEYLFWLNDPQTNSEIIIPSQELLASANTSLRNAYVNIFPMSHIWNQKLSLVDTLSPLNSSLFNGSSDKIEEAAKWITYLTSENVCIKNRLGLQISGNFEIHVLPDVYTGEYGDSLFYLLVIPKEQTQGDFTLSISYHKNENRYFLSEICDDKITYSLNFMLQSGLLSSYNSYVNKNRNTGRYLIINTIDGSLNNINAVYDSKLDELKTIASEGKLFLKNTYNLTLN